MNKALLPDPSVFEQMIDSHVETEAKLANTTPMEPMIPETTTEVESMDPDTFTAVMELNQMTGKFPTHFYFRNR